MENIEMEEKNQCYIVSLDNGIRREEPITIKVFNNFSDGTQLVQLNQNVFGVYKSYSLNPETMYIDDYDIIKNDIAELLDIDHEETRRIVNDEQNIGVFTSLNYRQNIETRISATAIFQQIVDSINNGIITGDEAIWASGVLRLPATSKGNALQEDIQIRDLVELGIYAILKKISLEKGEPLNSAGQEAIKKAYIRMILFDMLVGRKYRGLDYSLICELNNSGNPAWDSVHFGPISVSNSIDKDDMIADNEYMLNNRLVNKEKLLNILFEEYYNVIKKISESLNDAIRLYDDAITRIIYNNTDLEKGKEIEELILGNLNDISKCQKNKEKQISSEKKMNKVEKTMATQSINVRVTAKLDLIQKKYPINPKEHPDLLFGRKKKKNKDEKIKLIVEEEKASKSGFANSAILISAVALICGIGFGIAYVLLTIGG